MMKRLRLVGSQAAGLLVFNACVVALMLLGLSRSASAQEEDTTDADLRPVVFETSLRGRALSDSLPALMPEIDLVGLLAHTSASFTFLFDRPGWPDAWSPYGLGPNLRPLTFEGIPFTHVFTGRPAYNLVPSPLLERPHLEVQRFGRPAAILTRLRPFVSPIPITEATYWRGGDGLQSIDVVHAQHRRRALFGEPGFLNVMGSYSGRATDVIYPGSDLTRGRRLQARIRYEQAGWSAEVLNVHNRREIGAHAGVIPPAGNFNGIYQAELAQVEMPEAERRVIRNDLIATLHARLVGAGVTTASAYWTAETFRYRSLSDTLLAESDRLGLRTRQTVSVSAAHRLDVHVEGFSERTRPGASLQAPANRRSALHAYLRDSLAVGRWAADLEAGWFFHRSGGPTASISTAFDAETFRIGADVSRSHPTTPTAYETGFGDLTGLAADPGHIIMGRLEAALDHGAITVAVGAFGHHAADPVDVFADGDSAAVHQAGSPFRQAGLYADLAWRRDAERGFYAVAKPTYLVLLNADASALHERLSVTLPTWTGRARIGARYAIFQGDLDFDLYVEAVSWSGLSSRHLHPPTGFLTVPDTGALRLGASNMINVTAEVRVRDAMLYLVYDNLLSGTSVLPGNMLVPIYPLPAQRFRFGVYWPIFG